MPRARRLASVAVAASLAVSGLAACRSEPAVAAYLPSGNISTADVQAVYDNARDQLRAQAAAAAQQNGASAPANQPVTMPISNRDVLNAMVSRKVLGEVAQANKVTVPADLPLDQYAQRIGLPATSTYVRTYVEVQGLIYGLTQAVKPATPTDADVRGVFERLKATGAMQAGLTPEQFAQGISAEAKQTLGSAISVRDQVQSQVDKSKIRINPRFDPAEIDVYTEQGPDGKPLPLVVVELPNAEGSVPVTDVA